MQNYENTNYRKWNKKEISNKDLKKIRITTDINYKMQTIQNINNANNDTISKII